MLPGVRIWLDVDCLDDVGKLEESVEASTCLCIFLSKGYFASANCRRELGAGVALDKPFILVHEADEAKGGASLAELEAARQQVPPRHLAKSKAGSNK